MSADCELLDGGIRFVCQPAPRQSRFQASARSTVRDDLARLHASPLFGSSQSIQDREIRFLKPDVAVVQASSHSINGDNVRGPSCWRNRMLGHWLTVSFWGTRSHRTIRGGKSESTGRNVADVHPYAHDQRIRFHASSHASRGWYARAARIGECLGPVARTLRSPSQRTFSTVGSLRRSKNQPLGSPVPDVPLFWHVYVFPNRAAADAAKALRSTIVEAFDKIWLFSVAPRDWHAASGKPVAVVGPLAHVIDKSYTARVLGRRRSTGRADARPYTCGTGGLSRPWRKSGTAY